MNLLRQILSNKDYKVLIENFLSLGALQFANLLLPLLVVPYVIKVIGFDYYGKIVMASALVMYFQSLVDYSFVITATRDVAIYRNSKQKLNLIFSKVMTVKFLFLVVSLFVISLLTYIIPGFSEYRIIIYFSMLMLIGKVLFPDWYFQGIEKMKYITMINIGVKVFFTLSIFFFVKNKEDYWVYPLMNSLGYIFAGIIALYVVLLKHKIQFVKLKNKQIIQTIKTNFPIFINQFMPVLYNNTSSFLLGIFVSNTSAGVFDALKKIVDLAIMCLSVISRVFFPFMNRKKSFFNTYKKITAIFVFVILLLILAFSDYIFRYFGINDSNSLKLLMILFIGVIGLAIYNIYGVNYLIINRKDELVMKNTIYISVFGVLLALPLIYVYDIYGAAISISLSRLFLGLGVYYIYLKKFKINE